MSVTLPILILAIPLFMFLLLGIGGVKMSRKLAGILGITALGAVAVISYYVAFTYFFSGDSLFIDDGVRQQCQMFDVTWLAFTDRMVVNIGFLLDPISAMMLVVITTISFMVHLYSWGYMEHEPGFQRYYAFLALFTFSMLGLVVATNIFQMYIFWELVGVSSYLLIGFFYKLPSAVSASKKAFIVTRFADLFMLIGILVLSYYVSNAPADGPLGSASAFNFQMLNNNAGVIANTVVGATFMSGSVLTWAMVLIFVGGMGKSAMLPLHIWLPKAHPVAPAPASALLSGVLTKAGIFGVLVTSCNLFLHNGAWGNVVLALGVATMFGGALLAMFSVDLKRTLACSSMSQIGFILVGVGMQCLLGHHNALAVQGTLLHMVNHSLIKLCLFMAAGAVYMNLHKLNLNDIRGFGRNTIVLHIAFLMGALGISGVPLWNGYISKSLLHESILEYVELLHEQGLSAAWYSATEWIFVITGGMTFSYMLKLYFALFWEKNATRQEEFDGMRKGYLKPLSIFALLARR